MVKELSLNNLNLSLRYITYIRKRLMGHDFIIRILIRLILNCLLSYTYSIADIDIIYVVLALNSILNIRVVPMYFFSVFLYPIG